jgi:hypothetical protein
MFIKWNEKKGQNTAEYAILIGVIVAAAIAMQVYIRRGMQSRIKDAVDYSKNGENNELSNFFTGEKQYEPYYLSSNFTTAQQGDVTEALQTGGGVVRDSMSDTTSRSGNQAYTNYVAGNV